MKKLIIVLLLISILPLVSALNQNINNNAVAYYAFDNPSTSVTDLVKGFNNITVASSNRASGIINNSYTPDADDVDLGFTSSGEATYIMWVNRTGSVSGSGVFITNVVGSVSSGEFRLNMASPATFDLDIHDGSAKVSSATSLTVNDFIMVTLIINSSQANIYTDVTKVAEVNLSGFTFAAQNLNLFSQGGASPINNMDFDEIAIFNQTLDLEEIEVIYNTGLGTQYPFDALKTNLLSPEDNANGATGVEWFAANHSTIYPNNITNATLYLYNQDGSINRTNISIITGVNNVSNLSLSNIAIGTYEWNYELCSVNGTGTNCDFAANNFTINQGFKINTITFPPTEFESVDTRFEINVTLSSGSNLDSVFFFFNNTIYSGLDIQTNGNNRSISDIITMPSVAGTTNISFYWNLTIDGTTIQSAVNEIQVNNLGIDECQANTIQIANYTIYDEDNRTILNNTESEIFVKLTGDLSGQIFNFYSNASTNNPITICISNDLSNDTNYLFESEVKYGGTNYATEFHNVLDQIVNTTMSLPLAYDLYDLLASRTTEFLITVRDRNFLPVENALIEITRQYLELGTFLTVEIPKTDSQGRTIGHFVTNDEVYSIFVKKDGELIGTFTNVKTFCADANNDCRLNLDTQSSSLSPESLVNRGGITYNTNYNVTTRTYTFTFSTVNSTSRLFNLTGTRFDNYQNLTLCSQALTASSGSLQCVFPTSSQNTTAIVELFVDGQLFLTDIFPLDKGFTGIQSGLGYLLAIALIITLPLIAYTNPIASVFMFLAGLVMASITGLLGLGGLVGSLSAFLWVVIAAAVLLFKFNKGREQ